MHSKLMANFFYSHAAQAASTLMTRSYPELYRSPANNEVHMSSPSLDVILPLLRELAGIQQPGLSDASDAAVRLCALVQVSTGTYLRNFPLYHSLPCSFVTKST